MLTAVVLLISITILVLLAAKTVLTENQTIADNYRNSQAYAAANAAMDYGVGKFFASGIDNLNTYKLVFYTGPSSVAGPFNCTTPPSSKTQQLISSVVTSSTQEQTTYGQFEFDNTPGNICDCTPTSCISATDMTRGLITARGWSDDCQAVHTITQCLDSVPIFASPEGPKQGMVLKAGNGSYGTAIVINRYYNASIWTGGPASTSGNPRTYIRPSGTDIGDYTAGFNTGQLSDVDYNNNAQIGSNGTSGLGVDVITDDNTLNNLTRSSVNLTDPAQNTFFSQFFAPTKAEMRAAAANANPNHYYSDSASPPYPAAGSSPPANTTGLTWVDSAAGMNLSANLGTPTSPIILIVNGDLRLTGNAVIYGVVYVTGTLNGSGTNTVYGSVINETGNTTSITGTFNVVYTPWGSGASNNPFIPGTGAIAAGSWKDW